MKARSWKALSISATFSRRLLDENIKCVVASRGSYTTFQQIKIYRKISENLCFVVDLGMGH